MHCPLFLCPLSREYYCKRAPQEDRKVIVLRYLLTVPNDDEFQLCGVLFFAVVMFRDFYCFILADTLRHLIWQ